jgi:hypothetical protein
MKPKGESTALRLQTQLKVFVLLLALSVTDCKRGSITGAAQPSGNTPALPSSQPGNNPSTKPLLSGIYTITEVEHDRIVDMIRPEDTTTITFMPDGSFTRVSMRGGKRDHTDSGSYEFDGHNLTLKTILRDNRVVQNPVDRIYTASLSADGDELRLVGKDGKVAVLRRMKGLEEQ